MSSWTGVGLDAIVIRGLRLWAHVGVLEQERAHGQWFELDLELAVDLAAAGRSDALADSLDYSLLITAIQAQARTVRCFTLESYAQSILDLVAAGCSAQRPGGTAVPLRLELRKCAAPVPGFSGTVAVQLWRPGWNG